MRPYTRTRYVTLLFAALAVMLLASCASAGGGQTVPVTVEGQSWISEFLAGVMNCVAVPIVIVMQLFGNTSYAAVDPNMVGRPAYVIGYLTLGVFLLVAWLRAVSRRLKR